MYDKNNKDKKIYTFERWEELEEKDTRGVGKKKGEWEMMGLYFNYNLKLLLLIINASKDIFIILFFDDKLWTL